MLRKHDKRPSERFNDLNFFIGDVMDEYEQEHRGPDDTEHEFATKLNNEKVEEYILSEVGLVGVLWRMTVLKCAFGSVQVGAFSLGFVHFILAEQLFLDLVLSTYLVQKTFFLHTRRMAFVHFAIRYWHATFWYLGSNIWHDAFGVWRLAFDI